MQPKQTGGKNAFYKLTFAERLYEVTAEKQERYFASRAGLTGGKELSIFPSKVKKNLRLRTWND